MRFVPIALIVAAASALFPAAAIAQLCDDSQACGPPSVQLVPSALLTTETSITLTIYASDGKGLALGGWQLWDNGAPMHSWFTGKTEDPGGLSQAVSATGAYTLSVGTHTLITLICDTGTGSTCVADTVVVVRNAAPTPPSRAAPVVTLAQRNDARLLDACATCASGTAAYSTPPFYMNGMPVSVTLYHSSELSRPTGFIELDVAVPASTPPTSISVKVADPVTQVARTLSNGATAAYVPGTTASIRLGAQFAADALATGVYTVNVVVTATWADTVITTTLTGVRVLVQHEGASRYGRGWVVSGDERIHRQTDGSLLLTDGAGGLQFFEPWICTYSPWQCMYHAPRTETASMLRKVVAGTSDTIWVRTERSGERTEWDNKGFMLRQVGVLGDTMRITRVNGTTQRIAQIQHVTMVGASVVSRTISFSYRTDSTLSAITLPDGRVSQFTFVGDSLLQRVTDPDSARALTATYANGRLVQLSGRDTASTLFTYDAFGQLRTVKGPAVRLHGGATVRDSVVIRSLRHQLLDSLGTSSGGPAKPATLSTGATLLVTDSKGTTSTVWGHVSGAAARSEVRTSSGQLQYGLVTYDTAYRPIAISGTGRAGEALEWSGPLLRARQDVLTGDRTEYYRSTADRLDSVRVNGRVQLRQTYAGASTLPTSVRTDSANVTSFTYDARGRVLTAQDAQGATVTYAYEATHGNVARSTRTASGVTTASDSTGYDASGRPTWRRDPLGRQFSSLYDAVNRERRSIGPSADTTLWTHVDSTGEYSVRDAVRNLYRTTVNARGWVVRQQDPYGRADSVAYDTLGRPVWSRSRRGDVTTLVYDRLGRLLRRTAVTPGGSVDSTVFAYDTVANRWWAVRNAESVDSTFLDAAGRPAQTRTWRSGKRFLLNYSYLTGGLVDRRTVIRDSANATLWSTYAETGYDSTRRGVQIRDFGGRTSVSRFDRGGRLVGDSLPTGTGGVAGVQRSTSYTVASQLTSQQYSTGATSVLNRTYAMYDALDRIGAIARPALAAPQVRLHEYDALGRLATWRDEQETTWVEYFQIPWDPYNDCPGCFILDSLVHVDTTTLRSASYTYDKVANRTGAGIVVDTANRMTDFDGWKITYDSAGFITKRAKWMDTLTYSWNALGQLVQVRASAPAYTVTYGYDGLGRRVRKTVNGVATRYLLDGDQVIVELDASWAAASKYTYYPGIDRPHGMVRANKRYYFAQDAQGNVVALLDSAGAVTQQYEYTPYGEEIAAGSTPVTNPYRYKGREWDAEARLYFMRARYYDPLLGRFISEDPIGMAGGINPTAFVSGDPINKSDPFGLKECDPLIEGRWGYHTVLQGGEERCVRSFEYATLDPVVIRAVAPIGFSPRAESIGRANWTGEDALNAIRSLTGAAPAIAQTTAELYLSSIPLPGKASVWWNPKRAGHIFRAAGGHVVPTTMSRGRYADLFRRVASNPLNRRLDLESRADFSQAGIEVYTWLGRSGRQVWVYLRNGEIVEAGVNGIGKAR